MVGSLEHPLEPGGGNRAGGGGPEGRYRSPGSVPCAKGTGPGGHGDRGGIRGDPGGILLRYAKGSGVCHNGPAKAGCGFRCRGGTGCRRGKPVPGDTVRHHPASGHPALETADRPAVPAVLSVVKLCLCL